MARELADQASDGVEGDSVGANETSTDATDSDKGLLNRREYLRLGATAAAAATGAGAMSGSAAAAEQRGISFNNVVNAVDDLGMDPNGSDPIDSQLSSAMQSNTLIEFPAGEYKVTDAHARSGLDNFGIRGTGDAPSDVKFVFPSGNHGAPDPGDYVMLKLTGANGLLLENFEVHQTDDRKTGASFILYVEDKLEMHDVIWQGWNPVAAYAKGTNCYPSITNTSGVGHITGVEIKGGGVADDYPNRRMGFLMQRNHRGELVFKNLDIRELGSSALRGTKCPGAVKVEDSYFENNDNGSIRIGGGRDGESYAKRCTILVDGSRIQHPVEGAGYKNMDGIRMDSSGQGWSGALVEDCELIYREFPDGLNYSRGTISRPSFGDHAGFAIRNCNIQIDVPNCPALHASSPGSSSTAPYDIVLENVHITGQQSGNPQNAVVNIEGSNGSQVNNSCFSVPNGDLNGVQIQNSSNCAVTDSDIAVGGQATSFSGSSVNTQNLTSDGACRVPGDDIPDSSGSGSGVDASELPHTLEINGTGTPTNYAFEVEGDLAENPDGPGLERWDQLTSPSAEGWVTQTSDADSFRFSGGVASFEFREGEAELVLDGSTVTPQELLEFAPDQDGGSGGSGDSGSTDGSDSTDGTDSDGSTDGSDGSGSGDGSDGSGDSGSDGSGSDGSDGSGSDQEGSQLVIRGTGEVTNYVFAVDGELAADTEADDIERWDSVSESSADGYVTQTSDVDTYRFTGDIVHFGYREGQADLTLDGQSVAAEDLGSASTISIVGYGSESATYSITASDGISPHPAKGDLDTDSTPGSSVEDAVTDGTHALLYQGEITHFALDGNAAVYLDGKQVDPDALAEGSAESLPNLIVVDGTSAGETTDYTFAVSGDVHRSPDLGSAHPSDSIDGGQVTGTVDGDVDGYRFSGNLTAMNVDGNASITFEDNDG